MDLLSDRLSDRGDGSLPLSKDKADQIMNAIVERTGVRTCAACGGEQFELQPEIGQVRMGPGLGPQMIPAAVVLCVKCGNIRLHALSRLGLMDFVNLDPMYSRSSSRKS